MSAGHHRVDARLHSAMNQTNQTLDHANIADHHVISTHTSNVPDVIRVEGDNGDARLSVSVAVVLYGI